MLRSAVLLAFRELAVGNVEGGSVETLPLP